MFHLVDFLSADPAVEFKEISNLKKGNEEEEDDESKGKPRYGSLFPLPFGVVKK